MEKKSKKVRFTNFCKDHAVGLVLGGIGVGCTICLGVAGYKVWKEMKNDSFVTVIKFAKKVMPEDGFAWFEELFRMDTSHGGFGYNLRGEGRTITVSDLGKLGEVMIKEGVSADRKISDMLVSYAE